MKRFGFTLTEVAIVTGIFILLSLITIPLLVNYQRVTKLRSEVRVLATNLKYAQQRAVTEQIIYTVVLTPVVNSYDIINSESSNVVKSVIMDPEVSINQITDLTNNTVQFTSTGSAIESGSIQLANSNNETVTIEIKPSGYVQIIE